MSSTGNAPTPGEQVVSEDEFVSERMAMMISAILEDKQTERISCFQKEQTDEDRFSYVWAMPQLHEVIQLEEEFTGKSSTDAIEFRQKGNKYFSNKSFISALDAYSRSVIHAPVYKEGRDNTNELALAYGNRSAALFHLNRFHDCLDDIDLAFKHEYAKDSHYKLYDRRGKCYLAIDDVKSAKESFQQALENVAQSGLDARVVQKWQENLTAHVQKCVDHQAEIIPEENIKVLPQIPKVTHSTQEKYPLLSKDVKVEYNSDEGRHLIATEDITTGDVLLVEKPFATVLYQEQYETHCYCCMLKIDRPIPCLQCSTIVFCSQTCREKAWLGYHQYECRHFVLLDKLLCARIGHLALRMLITAGLPFLLEYVRNQKNEQLSTVERSVEERDLACKGIYDGSYHNVYHLVTNNRERFPVNLFDFSVVAAFLTKILLASKFFTQDGEDYASSENIRLVGAVLLRHLQIIQCNACRIAEAVPGVQFDQRGNMTIVGMGIYPTASLVNHSCDPVADFLYYRDNLVLRAIRNVRPGEAVTVSYGLVYFDADRKARQPMLRESYFFPCECQACAENWPTVVQLADCDISFKCEACRHPLDLFRNPYKKIAVCEECEHEHNMEKIVRDLEDSHGVFCNAMIDAFAGRHESAVENFKAHLSLLQKHVNQPWRDFTSCQLCIKQSFRLMASQ